MKPWEPGQSPNPSGRPRSAPFRKALKRVLLAEVKFKRGDARGKTRRLDALLLKVYTRASRLIDDSATLEDLMYVMPLLTLLAERMDPKEIPMVAEVSKQSRTFLVGGKETGHEETETKTLTQRVELTGGEDGRTDNQPRATSGRAKPRPADH